MDNGTLQINYHERILKQKQDLEAQIQKFSENDKKLEDQRAGFEKMYTDTKQHITVTLLAARGGIAVCDSLLTSPQDDSKEEKDSE